MESVRKTLTSSLSYLVARLSSFVPLPLLPSRQVVRVTKKHQPRIYRALSLVAVTMLVSTSAWAQEGGKPAGGGLGLFAPMILVFLIFYFLLIRPQSKQQKKHQELLKMIVKGDEVVTNSGIHGKVTSVTDQTVGLEIADNVRIRLEKKQIAQVKNKPAEQAKAS